MFCLFFPISGQRPENAVLAAGQGRSSGLSNELPVTLIPRQ